MAICCVLRTTSSFSDSLTFLELLYYYLSLAMIPGFAYYVIQRNGTTNDSIFHLSDGMQVGIPRCWMMFALYSWLVRGLNSMKGIKQFGTGAPYTAALPRHSNQSSLSRWCTIFYISLALAGYLCEMVTQK